MSYILDALRRADAERDRGHVPGIHAQPAFAGVAPPEPRAAVPPWVWAAGALALVVVAALAWIVFAGLTQRGAADVLPPRPVASGVAAPAPAATGIAPALPVEAASVPAAPAVAAPRADGPPARTARATPKPAPAPVPVPAPRTARDAGATARTPTRPEPPADRRATADAPRGAAVRPAPDATAPAERSAPGAASTEGRIYALHELPDEIRRQLPTVTVGGSMYSKTPADRILIVNGQVLHEGDKITPDLVVQQIRLKAAVLAYKGFRYTITY